MGSLLCITVRFLQPYSHGRGENGSPEWPPSPLRLMQALVAAGAGRWNERSTLQYTTAAFRWLETLPPPCILSSAGIKSQAPCQFFVPDNIADLLVPAWMRGETTKQVKRTEKVVCPTLLDGDTVHYLYTLTAEPTTSGDFINVLTAAARSITHLGWGIDMAVGDASVISGEEAAKLEGVRWKPSPTGGTPLRVPKAGTLDDLVRKHADFLNRVTDDGFRPVPPLRVFDIVRYRSQHDPAQRPFRLFELRNLDGSRCRYPHRKLIHIAGMVRHLANEVMKKAPPRGVDDDWIKKYVVGHREDDSHNHRQLSYLPLPSVGHEHTDPGIRRMMIAAPPGDDAWLEHVARRLVGQQLKPVRGDEFAGREPPILVPIPQKLHGKGVPGYYTRPANVWHSFTPVILPGHDDHNAGKTRALIKRTLVQSGIEQPCEFEWSAHSRFSQSFSAHKYDRNNRPQGYFRPDHLLTQTAVHLTLRFNNGLKVPGPLAIGAGRHCGFGLMASIPETSGD